MYFPIEESPEHELTLYYSTDKRLARKQNGSIRNADRLRSTTSSIYFAGRRGKIQLCAMTGTIGNLHASYSTP